MPLIDDDGNLLGVINVIDALVVVLLLVVVAAGIGLVISVNSDGEPAAGAGPNGDPETRYVTLELRSQPDYVADRLDENETAAIAGTDDNITLTDVFVTAPTVNETQTVRVRAAVEGLTDDDTHDRNHFRVGGDPLRIGDGLRLDLGWHATNVTVTDLSTEGETLAIERTTTVVDVELDNVDPNVADELAENMTETVRGETIATIESVEREPATVIIESDDGNIYEREHPRNERVTLTVELRTTEHERETGTRFRGERLGAGTTIALDLDTTTVSGTVTDIE
ncbi:DUF4330 family protein [Natrialba asiatica]|uniref:DUF4330 domain-containing protein n=1 Tax=Natrialba asiatica (strain ATCC 700177 / DSM 12278 / JCM 9576 / FERM P-10747 / NBRC 102637 / 172P1) TaxID=29540 RepID=M0ASW9_NATA1|nr:DUF4330 family protein [Natrialba asiatica]ELZ01811.1 hypothetical protein C481_09832 [Natrialba asiatica DSM 12278]